VSARDSIRQRGGLAATHELYAAGIGRAAISSALRAGTVMRVRQGWYAEVGIHPELLRAARVGGRATCSTALRLLSIWVVDDGGLHVSVRPEATQLRHSRNKARRIDTDPSRVRVHWRENDRTPRSRLIVSPIQALRDYAHCAPAELVGAAAESIAHHHPHLLPAIHRFGQERRGRLASVLAHVDGICESGTEFLVRWRMSGRLSVPISPQVSIPGVGRVDFLVGRRLVVEVDSEKYHTDPAQYEEDRRRDAALSIRNIRSLRFSYRQVMSDWSTVDRAIKAAVARGDAW
jgi:very-short-patch-repair endonuclease